MEIPRIFKAKARLIMALPLLSLSLCGHAAYKTGYYDRMDGKSKESLKSAAKACVKEHQQLDYYNLPNNWIYTDIYPERYNGQRRWWEMYSRETLLIGNNQSGTSSFSANKMQREHSVPKSWWKKNGEVEYTPAYTDMWNLYPSEGAANQAKSNYPFAECRAANFDNGCTKVGPPVSGQGGGAGNVFEPADEYKGDFARTIFYMATVYDDLPWVINYMFNSNSPYPTLKQWAIDTMLQWARRDPVSQKEIDRNDGVEGQQGNRNPFIDFPELAEYIWGTRTQETFLISEQGGNVTPPITGDAELTAPVNGEYLDFGQCAVGATMSRALEISGRNLTAPLSLSLSGRDRAMFTLSATSIPASTVNSTSVYRLEVLYTPTSIGDHQAAIALYDGGLSGSVAVNIKAKGCPVPELSPLTAYEATDVTADGYTAHWSVAPETVDYYELRRVRYLPEGEEVDLEECGQTALEVTGRDAAVPESYTVSSVRLGYRSQASNSIIVAADSSVGNLSGETLTYIATWGGRWQLLTGRGSVMVTIYDLNGRIVSSRECADGEYIELPEGIDFGIATAEGMERPVKLMK